MSERASERVGERPSERASDRVPSGSSRYSFHWHSRVNMKQKMRSDIQKKDFKAITALEVLRSNLTDRINPIKSTNLFNYTS